MPNSSNSSSPLVRFNENSWIGSEMLKDHTQRLFQTISSTVSDAVIVTDFDGNIHFINQCAERLLNEDSNHIMTRNIAFYFNAIPSIIKKYHDDQLSEQGYVEDEVLLTRSCGAKIHIKLKVHRDRENGWDIFHLCNISKEKEIEREDQRNQQMLYNIFTQAADSIIIFKNNGTIINVNPVFCKKVNLGRDKILGQKVLKFIPEGFYQKMEKINEYIEQNKKVRGEIPIIHDGGLSVMEFNVSPNIFQGLHMAILRDITEKRQMEIKLKRSEEQFEDLFEETIDAIVFWDQDGKIMRVNKAALSIFECTEQELIGSILCDFLYEKDKKFLKVMKEFQEVGSIRDELLFLMPNGQLKHLEFTARMHPIDGYNITIFRNVSERYQMEKELRESETKFRKVFEGTLDGMLLWDQNYKLIDMNPVAKTILNCSDSFRKGMDIRELINENEETKKEFRSHMKKLAKYGKANQMFIYKDQDSNLKHLEISTKCNLLTNMNLTVIRDVTEKIEMEEQLRKSDTLNVVGELAAGIAHEIRNPMTALKGFIQLLENSMDEPDGGQEMYFNVISSELKRIESIITEFLVLAKPQAIHYLEYDVRKIMTDTIELLNAQALMHGVEFEVNLEDNLPSTFCEPNQLKQVFINIIKNAIEVMPKGGTITINMLKADQEAIKISIKDEGSGIPHDKIKKLGEPFYTTKDRGTGLGLMVSFKIIKEHKGNVEVESELGKGTTFHITLPTI
ncbi:PAS domain S-box protein [Falsibacillus pallidus]|uniref:PAS domain S-box protein n=1 Tax=Falsibacillus pallidus TaxID=493781 RepID=UPI003D97AE23